MPSAEPWEGCLAYELAGDERRWALDARARLLEVVGAVPRHLQLPPHVTLKHLGLQPRGELERLQRDLRSLALEPVTVAVAGSGSFRPAPRSDRASLHVRLERHPLLLRGQSLAEAAMARNRCPDRDRYSGPTYAPHVTLVDGVCEPALERASALLGLLELPARLHLSRLVLLEKPAEAEELPRVAARWSAGTS